MTGLVRNELGLENELQGSFIFHRVPKLSIIGREDGDDYAGIILVLIYDIANGKFWHRKFLELIRLRSPTRECSGVTLNYAVNLSGWILSAMFKRFANFLSKLIWVPFLFG
jgi:hypothetical protein